MVVKRFLALFQTPGTERILYFVYILTVAIQSYAYAFSGNKIIEHVSLVWTKGAPLFSKCNIDVFSEH